MNILNHELLECIPIRVKNQIENVLPLYPREILPLCIDLMNGDEFLEFLMLSKVYKEIKS